MRNCILLVISTITSVTIFATTPLFNKEKLLLSENSYEILHAKNVLNKVISKEVDANAKTLPYMYSFEQSAIANIGTDGWLTVDANNRIGLTNVTTYGLIPEGDFWAYSNYDNSQVRNAWFLSPDFSLSAGVTYFVSVYVYAPGWNNTKDEFKITAGTAQNTTSQTELVLDYTGVNANVFSSWTKVTGTFTPSESANYFFGINHCTSVVGANLVGFDAFTVKANSEYILSPYVKIHNKGGLWSNTISGNVYLSRNEELGYMALAKNTETLRWTFPSSATPSVSEDADVNVSYPLGGVYESNIQATGQGGSSTDKSTITIINPASTITKDVYNLKPTDKYISNTSISTNTYDYGLGINTFWRKWGEKFVIPSDVEITINSIGIGVAAYAMQTANTSKTVKIGIYPVDSNGKPAATAQAEYSTTFAALFGSSAISSKTIKTFTLPSALKVKGSFFIVFDFTAYTAAVSATDRLGIYRAAARFVNDNTSYVYYTSQSAWKTFSEIANENTSGYVIPNLTFSDPITSIEQINIGEKPRVTVINNIIRVYNILPDDEILIHDITGKLVFSQKAETGEIKHNLGQGIYVLCATNFRCKIVLK